MCQPEAFPRSCFISSICPRLSRHRSWCMAHGSQNAGSLVCWTFDVALAVPCLVSLLGASILLCFFPLRFGFHVDSKSWKRLPNKLTTICKHNRNIHQPSITQHEKLRTEAIPGALGVDLGPFWPQDDPKLKKHPNGNLEDSPREPNWEPELVEKVMLSKGRSARLAQSAVRNSTIGLRRFSTRFSKSFGPFPG